MAMAKAVDAAQNQASRMRPMIQRANTLPSMLQLCFAAQSTRQYRRTWHAHPHPAQRPAHTSFYVTHFNAPLRRYAHVHHCGGAQAYPPARPAKLQFQSPRRNQPGASPTRFADSMLAASCTRGYTQYRVQSAQPV